jgi:hypothetical protein
MTKMNHRKVLYQFLTTSTMISKYGKTPSSVLCDRLPPQSPESEPSVILKVTNDGFRLFKGSQNGGIGLTISLLCKEFAQGMPTWTEKTDGDNPNALLQSKHLVKVVGFIHGEDNAENNDLLCRDLFADMDKYDHLDILLHSSSLD